MIPTAIPDHNDNNKQSFFEKFLFPVRSVNKKKLAVALHDKTILVTGATYGIGAVLAEILSNFEVRLILVARTKEKLDLLQQAFQNRPCEVLTYSVDLREETQINTLLQNLNTQQIEVDIFISNAGKSIHRGLINSLDRFHDTQRCSATNYTGPVQLLLGILPGIIKRKGHVLNISALNVLLPPTMGWSAYQSSKAAFDQWLRCIEPELKVSNVNVSSIYLPLVRTRMSMVNEQKHHQAAMSKEKAVNVILKCIASKKRKYQPWWTGFVLFWCSLFPNVWYRLQVRQLKKRRPL